MVYILAAGPRRAKWRASVHYDAVLKFDTFRFFQLDAVEERQCCNALRTHETFCSRPVKEHRTQVVKLSRNNNLRS
jgi:hypothetical protein